MTWTDLGNPSPKSLPSQYQLHRWCTGEIQRLHAVVPSLETTFDQVLATRRTVRHFGALEALQLDAFLWQAFRCREIWTSTLGFDLEHRATPSAGAIHPIHLIINKPSDDRWWLYQPQGHYLAELVNAPERLAGLREQSMQVLESSHATMILLLAEPGKTSAKYENACSLIWRDAGALLSVAALTAHAQGLNFCPLGITGEPWASSLADEGQLVGVGVGLLGLGSRA